MNSFNRGDIFVVDFGFGVGSEQGGMRPAIILQNNKGNYYAPTVMVAPITSALKAKLPTHVVIHPDKQTGVRCTSIALYEQIMTVDKTRLQRRIGHKEMTKWDDRAIAISFGCESMLDEKDKERIEVKANGNQL